MPRAPKKPSKSVTKTARSNTTKPASAGAGKGSSGASKSKGAGAAPAARPQAAPAPKQIKYGPQDPEGNTALRQEKKERAKPVRTLVPIAGSGKQDPKPDKTPEDWRLQQWPTRGAPGVGLTFCGWDVETLQRALVEHAMGNPRMTGVLLDDMKVNPIIAHGIEVRQEAFRTLPRQISPGGVGPRGGQPPDEFVRFADFWREVLPDIIPDGTLDDWWLHLAFMGESLSAMDWEERTDGRDRWWLPYIKPWHPSQMYHYYRPDRGDRTPDGQVLAAITRDRGPLIVEPGGGRWVYISRGTLAPWQNALVRVLGETFLGDTFTLRDNLALQERYGQGVTKMFHPVEWAFDKVDAAVGSVYASGKGGVIPLPMTADGKRRADLELLAPSAAGAGLFDMTERRLIRRILISLLGQDMTTVGQTGGFAQAAIHNQVLWHKRERDAATFGDARLVNYVDEFGKIQRKWVPYSGPIRQQIARWVAYFNVGTFDAAPFTYYDATPPEDALDKEEKEARAASSRATGLAALAKFLPDLALSEADLEYLLKQCGIILRAPKEVLPDAEDGDEG